MANDTGREPFVEEDYRITQILHIINALDGTMFGHKHQNYTGRIGFRASIVI